MSIENVIKVCQECIYDNTREYYVEALNLINSALHRTDCDRVVKPEIRRYLRNQHKFISRKIAIMDCNHINHFSEWKVNLV